MNNNHRKIIYLFLLKVHPSLNMNINKCSIVHFFYCNLPSVSLGRHIWCQSSLSLTGSNDGKSAQKAIDPLRPSVTWTKQEVFLVGIKKKNLAWMTCTLIFILNMKIDGVHDIVCSEIVMNWVFFNFFLWRVGLFSLWLMGCYITQRAATLPVGFSPRFIST